MACKGIHDPAKKMLHIEHHINLPSIGLDMSYTPENHQLVVWKTGSVNQGVKVQCTPEGCNQMRLAIAGAYSLRAGTVCCAIIYSHSQLIMGEGLQYPTAGEFVLGFYPSTF